MNEMNEKILNVTLAKISELASTDLVCPISEDFERLSHEQLILSYKKAWNLICDIHFLAFDCIHATRLFKTLDL